MPVLKIKKNGVWTEVVPDSDVSGQINTHNTNTTAHNDIRTDIEELKGAIGGLKLSVKENGILIISIEEE